MTFDFEDPGNPVDVTFWKLSTCFVNYNSSEITIVFIEKVRFLPNTDILSYGNDISFEFRAFSLPYIGDDVYRLIWRKHSKIQINVKNHVI